LGHRLDARTGDEVQTLAETFNAMIDNIQRITSEKERIGAELNVAAQIQTDMLPCVFPPYPDRPEFDLYATMLPAKEVGGDFYDFFLVREDLLALVIADVSGKGVPAALFMVIAKTLIKNNACAGLEPKEVFNTVNAALCENNETGMFVTAFMGFLDLKTGQLVCVNAGHNPPLARRGQGGYAFIKTRPGFILGGMETTTYQEETFTLAPGDILCLYTDGVTEAANPAGELFAEKRLLAAANLYGDAPAKEFMAGIKAEVDRFADGAEQADDMTMLVLKIKSNEDEDT
jgi:sigma-B regulation protein RsbU (phosphoserine phosphatase)